jgi:hypothetical protein
MFPGFLASNCAVLQYVVQVTGTGGEAVQIWRPVIVLIGGIASDGTKRACMQGGLCPQLVRSGCACICISLHLVSPQYYQIYHL